MAGEDLMAGSVVALLGHHLEAFCRERGAERPSVGDDVLGVIGTELLKLGQRDRFSGHVVEVVGGANAGEDRAVQAALELGVIGV